LTATVFAVNIEHVVVPVCRRGANKMVTVHPQYVVDENQHPQAVLLPVAEWQQVVEALEELDDIQAYDEAKTNPQEAVAFEQAVRDIQEGHEA
jgi:PHD/YefM family antitoxin component YafN of YafNO toxin-antitoxin module